MGRGVSTCATCDGFFFKDQNIMVVGGGDSAMEEALYLSRLGRKVRGGPSARHAARLQDHAGARVQEPEDRASSGTRVVEDVLDPAQGKVTAVRLRNLKTGARWEAAVDGLFVAIGHEPNTGDLPRPARPASERLHQGGAGHHEDLGARRLRGRRRPGLHLPPGRDRRRHAAAWRPSKPSATSRPTSPTTSAGANGPGSPGYGTERRRGRGRSRRICTEQASVPRRPPALGAPG